MVQSNALPPIYYIVYIIYDMTNIFFRNDESAVLAAIEGRGDSKKQTSRTLAKLAQQLDEDL